MTRKPAGLSLAETIVSIFLLVTGAMATVSMALMAVRQQVASEQSSTAAQVGDLTLARLRQWARNPANFNSNWAVYQDASFINSDFPDYGIRVRCAASSVELYCPSTSSERSRPGQGRRVGSARDVEITVSWGTSTVPRSHRLVTRLYQRPEAIKATAPVTIEWSAGYSNPLAKDNSVILTAHLWGNSGQEITGIPFRWSVTSKDPAPGGMGTLEENFDLCSRQVRLHNLVYRGDPSNNVRAYLPGELYVQASARYQGVEYSGQSAALVLSGP